MRIVYFNHVLSWDEAYNVLRVNDYGASNSVWRGLASAHPPLYLGTGLLFQKLTHASRQNVAFFLEFFSVLCSMAIVLLIYLCGKDWFNEKTGLIAAFLYAIIPAARVFDTWIKQDSLMMAFVMAFLLFFFRKKYLISGLFLGLALLTKENALFLIFVVGIFLLISGRFKNILKLLFCSLVALVVSGWWYYFFSHGTGEDLNFFLGKSFQAKEFAAPWYHYLVRIPSDFGWVVVLISLVALVLFVMNFGQEKKGMVPFLLIWIVFFYTILSISYGKQAWVIQPLFPPFALLGAWGLARVSEVLENRKLSAAVIGLVMLSALGLSLASGFVGYMTKADVSFKSWIQEKRMTDYINSRSPDSTMIYFDDLTPVMSYYLKNYSPETTAYIRANLPANTNGANETLFLLDPNTDIDMLKQRIKTVAPGILVIRQKPVMSENIDVSKEIRNRQILVDGFKKYDSPTVFSTGYVFDGKKLSAAISNAR